MNIKVKDGYLYLEAGYLELYLPQYYLDHNIAKIIGSNINTLGFMNYKYYTKEGTKPTKIGVLNVPANVNLTPNDIIFNVKDTIYPDGNIGEYITLKFYTGDKIMRNNTTKSLDNVVYFTNLLLAGKIDNNIPYDIITKGWVTNMTMNGVNFNVPSTILELIVSEMCRDKTNNERPFRKVVGKNPDTDMVAYYPSNIRTICSLNSVFAALTFEDMNSMLDASLNITAKGKKQNISPVEKIIKM